MIEKPQSQTEFVLEELVAQITPENRVEEISFGPPVGNELISKIHLDNLSEKE